MSKLIDAQWLMSEINGKSRPEIYDGAEEAAWLLKCIRSALAENAALRDRAFWQDENSESVSCSHCYSVFTRKECEDFFYCPEVKACRNTKRKNNRRFRNSNAKMENP